MKKLQVYLDIMEEQKHRKELIEMYEGMVSDQEETEFMQVVLNKALYYLKNKPAKPKDVEDWVSKLERLYRKGPYPRKRKRFIFF